MIDDDQMPSDLQRAFGKAMAEYRTWRSGPEPTVSYQMKECPITLICELTRPYESVPLQPGIMNLLLYLADDRHADLKSQLADNYASAGQYLLRLIGYREEWHRRRDQQT
jgi:hypothetical protein